MLGKGHIYISVNRGVILRSNYASHGFHRKGKGLLYDMPYT